jgi:ubiquinone/menaquinone biosynthesis C-methylase UbiE
MENKKQSSPEGRAELEPSYFEFGAYLGVTKHAGGLKATEELIELCHINKDSYVLDVGCGIGITPCYIAEKYGTKVVSIDLSEDMVQKSRERAKRKRVEDRVEFRMADAQNLPFEDNMFDAVICESVNAFINDKQKAINEYVRVTKRGGYVGLNEGIWIKPPPPELLRYASHVFGKVEFLESDGWRELLKNSGVKDITARAYKVSALNQILEEIQQLDTHDFWERMLVWPKFLSQCIKNSAFRKYVKGMMWPLPLNFFEHFGYGIYVGRKK